MINHLISGNTATKHMSTMKTTMVCMSHLKKTFLKKVFYCDYEPYKNLNIFIFENDDFFNLLDPINQI